MNKYICGHDSGTKLIKCTKCDKDYKNCQFRLTEEEAKLLLVGLESKDE